MNLQPRIGKSKDMSGMKRSLPAILSALMIDGLSGKMICTKDKASEYFILTWSERKEKEQLIGEIQSVNDDSARPPATDDLEHARNEANESKDNNERERRMQETKGD